MSSYQPSFFNESERYLQLDKLSDPLTELNKYINFEFFHDRLEKTFEKPKSVLNKSASR